MKGRDDLERQLEQCVREERDLPAITGAHRCEESELGGRRSELRRGVWGSVGCVWGVCGEQEYATIIFGTGRNRCGRGLAGAGHCGAVRCHTLSSGWTTNCALYPGTLPSLLIRSNRLNPSMRRSASISAPGGPDRSEEIRDGTDSSDNVVANCTLHT